MEKLDSFFKFCGLAVVITGLIFIAHSALHIYNVESSVPLEVRKLYNSTEYQNLMQDKFASLYNEQIDRFHNHIQNNEMQILFGTIFELSRKNNLQQVSQEELDAIIAAVKERERLILAEEDSLAALEKNTNIEDLVSIIDAGKNDPEAEATREANVNLVKTPRDN